MKGARPGHKPSSLHHDCRAAPKNPLSWTLVTMMVGLPMYAFCRDSGTHTEDTGRPPPWGRGRPCGPSAIIVGLPATMMAGGTPRKDTSHPPP